MRGTSFYFLPAKLDWGWLRGIIVFATPRWKLPQNNEVGEKASGSCSACLCLSGLMLLTISGVVIRRFPHCSFVIYAVLMRWCSLAFRGQSHFRPFPATVELNIACCHFSWVSCCTTLIQTLSHVNGMLCVDNHRLQGNPTYSTFNMGRLPIFLCTILTPQTVKSVKSFPWSSYIDWHSCCGVLK